MNKQREVDLQRDEVIQEEEEKKAEMSEEGNAEEVEMQDLEEEKRKQKQEEEEREVKKKQHQEKLANAFFWFDTQLKSQLSAIKKQKKEGGPKEIIKT